MVDGQGILETPSLSLSPLHTQTHTRSLSRQFFVRPKWSVDQYKGDFLSLAYTHIYKYSILDCFTYTVTLYHYDCPPLHHQVSPTVLLLLLPKNAAAAAVGSNT